jgi:hypothetical protein
MEKPTHPKNQYLKIFSELKGRQVALIVCDVESYSPVR